MKSSVNIIIVLIATFLGYIPSLYATCPSGADCRCDAPPFFTSDLEPPNVLFVVDISGSMGWYAYTPSNYQGNEEGYFRPDRTYYFDSTDTYDSNTYGTWKEVKCDNFSSQSLCESFKGCAWDGSQCVFDSTANFNPLLEPNLPSYGTGNYYTSPTDSNDICPDGEWGIDDYKYSSDSNGKRYTFKGSCLNVHLMDRIDVARWAITGGRPVSCSSITDINCDPNLTNACDPSTHICRLRLNEPWEGDVDVPDDRIDGFIQAAESLQLKPRLGLLFYSYDVNSDKVYIGDYPNGNDADPIYPFTYIKRFLNYKSVGGSTGTFKAMEEAYDYFKQSNDHSWPNGFSLSKGTYKDPLYVCDATRSNCEALGWCASHYVILLSDGQWNTPSCTSTYDPVRPSYYMHTALGRTVNGHNVNIEKVYALGVFMGGTGAVSMANVAMYGAFDLSSGNTWPGGTSGFPTTSCAVDDCSSTGSGSSCEPVPDPSHSDWDADGDGVPDTFFSPQNASDLKRNLFSVFADIVSEVGASASVATVTQNVLGQDVVIRGAFRHNPPDGKIWEGHLESFWPIPGCVNATNATKCAAAGCTWDNNASECKIYSFQNPQNEGKFCSDPDYIGDEYCWDAHESLSDQAVTGNRNIFTFLNGNKVALIPSNANLLHSYINNDIDFNGDGNIDVADTYEFLRWLNGEWDDLWSSQVRNRSGLLGDIVYSSPVVIGEPSLSSVSTNIAMASCTNFEPCFDHGNATSCNNDSTNGCHWDWFKGVCKASPCSYWNTSSECTSHTLCQWDSATETCKDKDTTVICSMTGADECFYTYRLCNAHRKKIAVVGANDGMLHAFVVGTWDETSESWIYDPTQSSEISQELWAYVPSNLLSDLPCLAKSDYGDSGCQHRTMVDLSPKAWDITLESTSGVCEGSPTANCSDYDGDPDACTAAGCTAYCSGTVDCSTLTDIECASTADCTFNCTGTYSCNALTKAQCADSPDCTWGCGADWDCTDLQDFRSCESGGTCTWDKSGCYWDSDSSRCEGVFDCSILNHSECNNYSLLCRWDRRRGECRNRNGWRGRCSRLGTESLCELYYTGSGCSGYCCSGTGTCDIDSCYSSLGCSTSCSGTATCSSSYCPTDKGCAALCTGTVDCSSIKSQSACASVGCTWTPSTTSPWRTVLIGGERGGGDTYFAIDVTNPDDPIVLWEHSVLRNLAALQTTGSGSYEVLFPFINSTTYANLSNLAFAWSTPYVGLMKLPDNSCFYALDSLVFPWSSDPSSLSPVCWGSSSYPLSGWVAIIGGGTRVFNQNDIEIPDCSIYTTSSECDAISYCSWDSSMMLCNAISGIDLKDTLYKPYFLVLDVATGINLMQYTWLPIQTIFNTQWPLEMVDLNTIPYAMNSPIIVDVWKGADSTGPIFGQDGYFDHIIMGDVAGHLWSIRLDENPSLSASKFVIDIWETKKAVQNCSSYSTQTDCENVGCTWNGSCVDGYGFRGALQPISVPMEAAFDTNKNLRLYFGTGKYEHVEGTHSDRNDWSKMSFYNLTLPLNEFPGTNTTTCNISLDSLPTINISCASNAEIAALSSSSQTLQIELQKHVCSGNCTGTNDKWTDPPNPDTCTADYVGGSCSASCSSCSCSSICYQCIQDLVDSGERVTNQALVAGELVFFTTYKPQSEKCSGGGQGYVYVVDYMCRKLIDNPLANSGLVTEDIYDTNGDLSAVRASLGGGVPSRPVLDSTGEHILIQTSDAQIHRIKVNLRRTSYLRGWRQINGSE